MISRSLAILLAVLGLYLSALDAAAQPRGSWGGREWGGRGGGGGGAFRGGGGRFPGAGPGRAGGFGPYGGYRGGFGGGFPGGYGGPGPRAFAPPPAFAGGGPPRGRNPFDGDWRGEQDEVRRAVREGRHIPLGRAIEAVRRRQPGRELDAGLEPGPGGRSVYRLRWAGQNGRRQDYMVDAETGAVLGVQDGP